MEQGTVGTAAGMSGLIPIVYSIVNFLVFRVLEQIRNVVVLQNLNALMKLINLKVYDPYCIQESFEEMV
jgi:transketolase C-terminal domain/subunit